VHSSGVEHRTSQDHGRFAQPLWAQKGSRRRDCSCPVSSRFQPQKGNRTGPWSLLVWSPTLTFSGSEPVRGPSERANAAVHPSSGSNARGSHLSFHRPSQSADIPLGVEKIPTATTDEGRRKEGKKDSRQVARVLHTRAHGSLSLSPRSQSASSASRRRRQAGWQVSAPGPVVYKGTRTLASLPTLFPGPSHTSFLRRRRF